MAAKLEAADANAKTGLFQNLKLAIEFAEQEQLPESTAVPPSRAAPSYPAQLAQLQLVTVPPDGLCLAHACIASFHAQRWRDEHGEKGDRIGESRCEERAEEQQAQSFREAVVQLMREYAQFDLAREFYLQRATAIAAGVLPDINTCRSMRHAWVDALRSYR